MIYKSLLIVTCFLVSLFALGNTTVKMVTNYGALEIDLDEKKAPITVKNFLNYVKKGHYDGTIFHRVINNFMIQGGGYDTNLQLKNTDKSIKNEATNGLKNTIGTISMARTSDPDSATSQFFINVKDNSFLDHRGKTPSSYGYAVFGKLKQSSMPILNRMKMVSVKKNGMFEHLPVQNLIIKSVTIFSGKKKK